MIVARFAAVDEVSVDAELTGAERARHDRLRFAADRDAYRAAHLLVRACAGELLGIAPARVRLQQHCPRCGDAGHGRPSIAGEPGVHLSLSHTRGFVAAVAAVSECGIDVERVADSIPRTAVTAREQTWLDATADPLLGFTRLWVRKEALVKAGIADEPGPLDVLGPETTTPEPATRIGGFALADWDGPAAARRPVVWGCVAVRAEPAAMIGEDPE